MKRIISIAVMLAALALAFTAGAAEPPAAERPVAKKVLLIGDSMTGWLAERLNAYAEENGFTVSAVIWDGSTMRKWASSSRLGEILRQQAPDALFVCLGMNSLFEKNPAQRNGADMEALKKQFGDIPVVWIGPPSWPGHKEGEKLNEWLASEMGEGSFFRSFDLSLPRQGARNPHPTRAGMIKWADSLVDWLETDGCIRLPGYTKPAAGKMSRPRSFTYKRMKEQL